MHMFRTILSKIKSGVKSKVRPVALILLALFFMVNAIGYGYQISNRDKPTRLGVSFSVKYSEELGLDWKHNYLALLDEVKVKHLRLMSYWDVLQPNPQNFDFADLDWQFDQAERHGATISLAIGQRQPRWPECHIPQWADALQPVEYKQALLGYIRTIVKRYKNSPALESYQLENEALNRNFGQCPLFERSQFQIEFDLVRSLDDEHDIITNASNQSGTPINGPVGDKIGFSIYKRAHFDAVGKNWSWSFWYIPSTWHSFRAALAETLHPGTESFIHELQAEPWGPEATVNLSLEEQNKTMNAKKLRQIVDFAKSTGMEEIDLWGGEWWYWRLQKFHDKELWQTVKDIYAENNNTTSNN